MKNIFDYKYLSKSQLKGLDRYKYSAIDTSPLSNYLMHPLWNTTVKIFPKWLAPNVLTFAGFILMMALLILLSIYDYSYVGPLGREGVRIPDWVFTVCAVCLFLAYNLDGLDGKQARRLGVSGPLGEMFDHGIDSFVVFIIPCGIISLFGREHQFTLSMFRGLLIMMSVTLNFYASHWEKYNTGVLYLPWGYDISMWICSLLFLIPGLYGGAVYHTYIFGNITFAQGLEVVVHSTGLFTTLPIAVYNVYLARKSNKSLHKSSLQILRPVWPMMVMNAAIITWAVSSPNNVLEYDPRAFLTLYGTQFSYISCRLIVAEISRQKCDVIALITWPLLVGVAISLCLPRLEAPLLYGLLVLSLIGHLHYAVCIVRQLCSHYRISCFRVPKRNK